ncbi:hypothetical protein ACIA8C_33720 [Nocardia sp. NPDC051321]|uniref:hypothetical protein n=1 Tax=Nocardia sp. NPDC051321 TaxID=3364323 RepID=UPI00378795DB
MKIPFELCSVQVAVGTLRLTSVELSMTYGNLIEGGPGKRVNDYLVANLARPQQGWAAHWHLVQPIRTMDNERELLPPVQCIGHFRGPCTNRTDDWLYSDMMVAWFQQPHPSGLIHPDAITQMYDIPWNDKARNITLDNL